MEIGLVYLCVFLFATYLLILILVMHSNHPLSLSWQPENPAMFHFRSYILGQRASHYSPFQYISSKKCPGASRYLTHSDASEAQGQHTNPGIHLSRYPTYSEVSEPIFKTVGCSHDEVNTSRRFNKNAPRCCAVQLCKDGVTDVAFLLQLAGYPY